jgi:anaerobic ribonucleoside-triphosphate reductase activating protein
MTLRVLDIIEETMVDGVGLRTSIYVAGCKHNCPFCHNPQSHDFNGGKEYEVEDLVDIVLADEFADLTLTGGDPMFQVDAVLELCKKIKEKSKKSIWLYSGFTIDQIAQTRYLAKILPYVDIIVDGRYVHELRNTELPFRGSENQRIIIVDKYLKGESDYEWKLN